MWGYGTQLKREEYMVQYLILWSAPLDVVYDGDDNVVEIYTSYE